MVKNGQNVVIGINRPSVGANTAHNFEADLMKGSFQNDKVLERRKQLGEFTYDQKDYEETLGQRDTRPETTIESGAKYSGEWLKGSQVRQGQGII